MSYPVTVKLHLSLLPKSGFCPEDYPLIACLLGRSSQPLPQMGLVGGGAPRSHLPQGPATLGWSLFGAAQVEPEPRFLGLGWELTTRRTMQRETLW